MPSPQQGAQPPLHLLPPGCGQRLEEGQQIPRSPQRETQAPMRDVSEDQGIAPDGSHAGPR